MRNIGIAVLVFAVFLGVSACARNNTGAPSNTGTPAPTQSPVGTPPASTPGTAAGNVDVEALYSKNCVACHAADMGGGIGPELKTVGSRLQAADIANIISQGQGRMTGFSGILSDAEISALADWLAGHKG